MDLHEKDMLAFARTWQPYGGNDDQILPEFGISEPTFYQRVLALSPARVQSASGMRSVKL